MEIISESQSKRINFPRRPSFFKNSEACPPPSAVASITNESRRIRSPKTLSSSRTGRWAISVGSDLSQFFGELVGRSFNLALVFFPAVPFPDFNSFLHSYDYGLFLKPGMLFQKVRNQNASQAVEFHFRSARTACPPWEARRFCSRLFPTLSAGKAPGICRGRAREPPFYQARS